MGNKNRRTAFSPPIADGVDLPWSARADGKIEFISYTAGLLASASNLSETPSLPESKWLNA